MTEIRKLRIVISGRVQGVGFRYLTKRLADQLNIAGAVWNNFDGSVEIEAIGAAEAIEKFIAGVRASPSPAGFVENLEITPAPELAAVSGFRIR